ncbi:MAG: hypothetical protein V3R29_10445, partial [Candidatus Acidoferrales bacterium]
MKNTKAGFESVLMEGRMKLRIAGRFAFFGVLAALLVALPAASQFLEKGSITGTVYDPSGAVVPG